MSSRYWFIAGSEDASQRMKHLGAKGEGQAARFYAGGSSMQDLAAMVVDAGFESLETQEMGSARFSAFPGAGIIYAHKS